MSETNSGSGEKVANGKADVVLGAGIVVVQGTDGTETHHDLLELQAIIEETEQAEAAAIVDGNLTARFFVGLAKRLNEAGIECSATDAWKLREAVLARMEGLKKNTPTTPGSPTGTASIRSA